MRGFQPKKYADGGVVPFGSRGLNDLRNLIPQMEAMGYKQAQPSVQPQQEPRGVAGLKAIIPQMEAMGYKQQPQYFADGGFVQGIKRAFGMDEERNAQIAAYRARAAAEKAQAQAQQQTPQPQQRAVTEYSGMSATQRREKELGLKDGGVVPRGFKPGGLIRGPGTGTSDSIQTEKRPGTFIMPADSTQAIGPEALEELGEVDDSAVEEQGEKVPVRLSNGEFELPPEQVQALGEAVLTVMRNATHQPVGEHGKAPTGKGFTPHQFFSGGGTVQAAYDDWQSKKQPWYMPTPRGNMEERTAEANYSQALRNQFSPKTTATAPTTTQNATDVRLAAGTVASPGAMAAARGSATPPKPAAAPVSMTGAPQQRAGQAQPFDFDTFEPAPGEGAFRNEQTGEVTRLQTVPSGTQIWKPQQQAPAAPAGFVPTSQRQGVRAPVLNQNGGVFSSMVDFTNQAGQAVQAIAANKGMRNDRKDALDQQRVGLDAASTFAKIEQGDRALGIDGRRADTAQDLAALQAEELGLKREAAGFQTRAAGRLEKLQDGYLAAKTPEERAIFARQIQELSGKADEANARMEVVRGSVDPTTGKRDGDYAVIFDPKTQTARAVQVDSAAKAAPPAPTDASKRVVGQTYTAPNGKTVRWSGTGWTPV